MKLTKTQLKRIIKEELAATLDEGLMDTVKSYVPGTDASAERDLIKRIKSDPGHGRLPDPDDEGARQFRDLRQFTQTISRDKFFAGYRKAGGKLVQAAFEADGDAAYAATEELTAGKITPKGYTNKLSKITGQESPYYGSD